MQVHVIGPGDTLWRIAQSYGVPLDQLITANQPPDPNQLVVGQTLVIPIWGRYHWVNPGETLWQIGQRYGVTVQRLVEINRIADPNSLAIGTRLYIPQQERPPIETNAYIEPKGGGADRENAASVAASLTYLSMFSYRVNPDGSLQPLADEAAIEGARTGGALPMMVITNIVEGQFDPDVARRILQSPEIQERLVNNILQTMRSKGFGALNVDFEHLRSEDREAYNGFLRRAAGRLHNAGYLISTALAPKVSAAQVGAWYEAHDYAAHGKIVDFVIIMTYEWGWSGGPPMAVAPIDQVARVLQYALTEMDANKVVMGIPLYGYDWTLPYVKGGPFAKVVSPQEAIRLAARYGVAIQYDPKSQSPFFRYTDQEGRQHEVWFEDARSIQAKFDLVKRLGIRGVSYWRLPLAFPQNWLLLADNFQVRKREG
jgi:spore germination protein